MSEVVEVVVKEEPVSATENTEEAVETVIDAAVEIAEKIDEARTDSAEVAHSLGSIHARIESLHDELKVNRDLIMSLFDEIAKISTLQLAEIVAGESVDEVEEILEVAEEIEDAAPAQETVEVAITPQVREEKKRKFI